MKGSVRILSLIAAAVWVYCLSAKTLPAAEQMRTYDATGGSRMRLEGDSTLHSWQCVSSVIAGSLEVGPNFPSEPGQEVKPGKADAQGQAKVTVRSLQSVKKDGSPYKSEMDDKMYEMLKATNFAQIAFSIKELLLKEAPKGKDAPYVYDAKGDLAVAGVTNTISFPVNVTVLPDRKLKITGVVPLKMTQFQIPPEKILFVKTADDVTVKFDWMLRPRKAAAAAATTSSK